MCGSFVAVVRQTVVALPSMTLLAGVGELSAATVQPLVGRGAAWVTATGTAAGMTCVACGSAEEVSGFRSCNPYALPMRTHRTAVAAARGRQVRTRTMPPRSGQAGNSTRDQSARIGPTGHIRIGQAYVRFSGV